MKAKVQPFQATLVNIKGHMVEFADLLGQTGKVSFSCDGVLFRDLCMKKKRMVTKGNQVMVYTSSGNVFTFEKSQAV